MEVAAGTETQPERSGISCVCSDSSGPEAEATPATKTTPASPSPTPIETEPAGELIEASGISVRTPAGWNADPSDSVGRTTVTMHSPDSTDHATISIRPDAPFDLKHYEDYALGYLHDVQAPNSRRFPRTTIAGIPAYHLKGRNDAYRYVEFGAVANNVELAIRFSFMGDKTEDQATIDEVLNSVEWR